MRTGQIAEPMKSPRPLFPCILYHMQRIATAHRWRGNLPNFLSASRLVLAVLFPWIGPAGRVWTVFLAAVSDLADGFAARRFGATSAAGGHLDAVADKIFVFTVLITFLVEGRLGSWQIACLLLRDVAVGMIALYAVATRRWDAFDLMPARLAGKVTTALMFLFLLAAAWPASAAVQRVAVVVVIIASGVAGVDYFVQFVRTRAADREKSGMTRRVQRFTGNP